MSSRRSRYGIKEALCAMIGPAGGIISTDFSEMLDVVLTDATINLLTGEKGDGGGQEAQVGKMLIPRISIDVLLDHRSPSNCEIADARES